MKRAVAFALAAALGVDVVSASSSPAVAGADDCEALVVWAFYDSVYDEDVPHWSDIVHATNTATSLFSQFTTWAGLSHSERIVAPGETAWLTSLDDVKFGVAKPVIISSWLSFASAWATSAMNDYSCGRSFKDLFPKKSSTLPSSISSTAKWFHPKVLKNASSYLGEITTSTEILATVRGIFRSVRW